jgi:hypothetical protein
MGSVGANGAILFAFIILFLGLFGLTLFGGLAWHYLKARRYAALYAALMQYEQNKHWSSGRPTIRDVHVNLPRAHLRGYGQDLVSV